MSTEKKKSLERGREAVRGIGEAGVCVCECVPVGEERERDGCVQSTQVN